MRQMRTRQPGRVNMAVINLDEQVREQIREKIITGDMGGGYHLSELKLSKEYNVSRTPIREALCALAADGLIEMVPHRGAFVNSIAQDVRVDQYNTYSLFMALIARQTSENGNIELFMDLETAVQTLAGAAEQNDNDVFMDALNNVNAMLLAASNSATLNEAVEMVQRRANTQKAWSVATGNKTGIAKQYNQLLQNIKKHETDAAETTMRSIMSDVTAPVIAGLNAEKSQKAS